MITKEVTVSSGRNDVDSCGSLVKYDKKNNFQTKTDSDTDEVDGESLAVLSTSMSIMSNRG